MLAFLAKGLTFFQIGFLFGFREICANFAEIPTGAIADVLGRRKSMIMSHVAYVVAFLLLGAADGFYFLMVGMFAFSIGEAFRTGTHKAIIFQWMKQEGIEKRKTEIYGHTRFYSKLGSAVSAWIAAGFVIWLKDYKWIFYISAIPIALNIINFMTYPKCSDYNHKKSKSIREVAKHLFEGLRTCIKRQKLRQLLVEATSFEGVFKSTKDYLQPVIKTFVLSMTCFLWMESKTREAIAIAIIYSTLNFLSARASKKAAAFQDKFKTTNNALKVLWLIMILMFALMLAGLIINPIISIVAFIVLAIIQNLWRPIMIGQIAEQAKDEHMATVLSTESQCKNLFVALAAPGIGYLADNLDNNCKFVPVAVLGIVVATVVLSSKLLKKERNNNG